MQNSVALSLIFIAVESSQIGGLFYLWYLRKKWKKKHRAAVRMLGRTVPQNMHAADHEIDEVFGYD